MKKWKKSLIFILLCLNINVVNAEEQCQNQMECLKKLAEYLSNLTGNLGYRPETPPATIANNVMQYEALTKDEKSNIDLYLGAIIPPIYSKADDTKKFNILPDNTEGAVFVNDKAASVLFKKDENDKDVSTMKTTDELIASPPQPDPIAQTLLTMLSTPPSGPEGTLNAASLQKQTANLPESLDNFYNYQDTKEKDNNKLSMVAIELNSNSLTTPLMVTDDPIDSTNVTAQQASKFIQYASGTFIPLDLPPQEILSLSPKQVKNYPAFRVAVDNYVLQLRTYVARLSVGLGNLYSILAKRMPQKDANGIQSSEALMEYKMASWRLFETANEKNPQKWLDFINNASPASVQKEMAILLAEINYQLYLSRQQQERLLLNNSILLLMNLTAVSPKSTALKNIANGGPGIGDQ